VPSLAGTLALTAAMGLGLALVRSQRERLPGRRSRRRARLGLLGHEPLALGLQRMALEQIDLALDTLEQGGGGANGRGASPPGEEAVHETRKAIKRLRALLRLLRSELGERAYRRESAALREIARQLSAARDAAVMAATVDALVERHPRRLARRGGVRSLQQRLAAERERARRGALAEPAARAAVLGELRALRSRVAAWCLPAGAGAELVEHDLERIYRQGRRRHRRLARRRRRQDALAMHRWRKRVKDLRYAAEMLERRDPDGGALARGKRLRRIAQRADELGELLGEEHDLAVLAEHLRAAAKQPKRARRARRRARRAERPQARALDAHAALWHVPPRSRKALLEAVGKRRRKLRARTLRLGAKLYARRAARAIARAQLS